MSIADFALIIGIADKIGPQIGVDFFVRLRRQTGHRVVLCGGFADEKRAKKMRQDDGAEFISGSLDPVHGQQR